MFDKTTEDLSDISRTNSIELPAIEDLSDISRTNQIELLDNPEAIANKIDKYLARQKKEIKHFSLERNFDKDKSSESEKESSKDNFSRKQRGSIQRQIRERLSSKLPDIKSSDIQYFLSRSNEETTVFFLSPRLSNQTHSGWKELFNSSKERIFNLVFKLYILSQNLPIEKIDSFEELLIVHPTPPSKKCFKKDNSKKEALEVWGQNLFVHYNPHNVLTLKLSRKRRLFFPQDAYKTLNSGDLGELIVFEDKNYYFDRDLDARHGNDINFMSFPKNVQDFETFKKTQLYYYHSFMEKLENFLRECKISFKIIDFQTNLYLEKKFITEIESESPIEIINNTGANIPESEQQALQNLLKHLEKIDLTFYNSGKTISSYERIAEANDDSDDIFGNITEEVSWDSIQLQPGINYLVLNKVLEEGSGSMAYQTDNDLWCASSQIDRKTKVDFYSSLKRKYSFLDTGNFLSMQGMNLSELKIFMDRKPRKKDETNDIKSILYHASAFGKKIDENELRADTKEFVGERFPDIEESITCYLSHQENSELLKDFLEKHKIKLSPEFKKVLSELKIKGWIEKSLTDQTVGLPVSCESFPEKSFFSIYVRSPRYQETKAVAVEFFCRDGSLYIKNVIRGFKPIKKRFKFLKPQKNNPEKLLDNQYCFVDESEQKYISCYTKDFYTPTLIGRNGILEDLNNGTLKISRSNRDKNARLLPLVAYYNEKIDPANRIHNFICLDSTQDSFIQYYVPPAQPIGDKIKKGFRVYHLIGKCYATEEEAIPTSELIEHPLTALHFSTLTQDIVKLGENSASSLLQKIARVFVEN